MRARRLTPPAVPAAVAATAAVLLVSGCILAPRLIAGLPDDGGWVVLPVATWAATERGEPEGIAACLAANCAERLMVSVLVLRGSAADEARAVIADPRRLAAFLVARDRADESAARRAVSTRVEARAISEDGLDGFVISLVGEGGSGRAAGRVAHGGVLSRPSGRELRVALVVGDDAAAVEAALRQVAQDALR